MTDRAVRAAGRAMGEIDRLRAQRDALLAALELLHDESAYVTPAPRALAEARAQARAAIAKAKEKAESS